MPRWSMRRAGARGVTLLELRARTNSLFQDLWTWAVGKPGYSKKKWNELRDALLDERSIQRPEDGDEGPPS